MRHGARSRRIVNPSVWQSPLEAQPLNRFGDLSERAVKFVREQQPRALEDPGQTGAPLRQRRHRQVHSIEMQQIEPVEHDRVVRVSGAMQQSLKGRVINGDETVT